jgi:hypothetical protein
MLALEDITKVAVDLFGALVVKKESIPTALQPLFANGAPETRLMIKKIKQRVLRAKTINIHHFWVVSFVFVEWAPTMTKKWKA